MGCWEIRGKECCFFIFLFFPRNVCHREKNVTELHRREIPGKDWVRMLWAAEAKALLFLDCRARDEMYNCPKDNGKAQNENRSDVNYWCFLGDCVVVMSIILFILIAFWFCLVVLCSPLLQFAMLAGERNYMETCRFSEKPPYILFNCLEKLFCTNSNSWNKAKRVWVNLFPLMRNRYSFLYLILWKFNIAPPGHCVHVPLQGWADASIPRVGCFLLLTNSKHQQRSHRLVHLW